MGNATPYANKKWVACSDNKTVDEAWCRVCNLHQIANF